jgi:hypothetical protein
VNAHCAGVEPVNFSEILMSDARAELGGQRGAT